MDADKSSPGEEQTNSDPPFSLSSAEASYDDPIYSTPEFRMYAFKVLSCSNRQDHDWASCPFCHPGEKAARRDLRVYSYSSVACPDVQRGSKCPRGARCNMAHSVFEYWLHPQRYRTLYCRDGEACIRKASCFFAHTADELRVVPGAPPGGDLYPAKYSCKPHPAAAAAAAASGGGAKAGAASGTAGTTKTGTCRTSCSSGSSSVSVSQSSSLPDLPTNSTAADSRVPSRSNSLGRIIVGINNWSLEAAAGSVHAEPNGSEADMLSSGKAAAFHAASAVAGTAASCQGKLTCVESSSTETGAFQQQQLEGNHTNRTAVISSGRQQQGLWSPTVGTQLAPATASAGTYNSNSSAKNMSFANIIKNLEEEAALNRQKAAAAQAAADYWMAACCAALSGTMHPAGSAVEDLLSFPVSEPAAQASGVSGTMSGLATARGSLGPLPASAQNTLACFAGLPTLQQTCSGMHAPAKLPSVAAGVPQGPETLLLLLAQQQQQLQQLQAAQAVWPSPHLTMQPDALSASMMMAGGVPAPAAGTMLAVPAAANLAPVVHPVPRAVATAQGLPMALAGYNMPAVSTVAAAASAGSVPTGGPFFQTSFRLV